MSHLLPPPGRPPQRAFLVTRGRVVLMTKPGRALPVGGAFLLMDILQSQSSMNPTLQMGKLRRQQSHRSPMTGEWDSPPASVGLPFGSGRRNLLATVYAGRTSLKFALPAVPRPRTFPLLKVSRTARCFHVAVLKIATADHCEMLASLFSERGCT